MVVITAGWRLEEAETDALRRDVHPHAVSLALYSEFERLASAAPALAQAYKERQARIRKMKALYRIRLHPALAVVRRLVARLDEDPELVGPALAAAVQTVREIDAQFLHWSDAQHQAFFQAFDPHTHPRVARVRAAMVSAFSHARAVVVAGGHVGVLRNRMDFFGLGPLLSQALARGVGLVAWSAGAMALADRVVLFHDDPPHGVGEPELLDRGLGVLPGLVVFPDARHRLRLSETHRVAALARRFAPAACLGLDSGAWLEYREGSWLDWGEEDAAYQLGEDGSARALPRGGADAPNS